MQHSDGYDPRRSVLDLISEGISDMCGFPDSNIHDHRLESLKGDNSEENMRPDLIWKDVHGLMIWSSPIEMRMCGDIEAMAPRLI